MGLEGIKALYAGVEKLRAESPDRRVYVAWSKAVSVRHFAHLYSLACYALEDAYRHEDLANMRKLVNTVSKNQKQSLDYIRQFVRFE